MNPEEWRRIEEFPSYFVSSRGRIRHKGAIIKTHPCGTSGGFSAFFTIAGRQTSRALGRLVLEAFVGPAPMGMFALHQDGNRANNNLENLCWAKRGSTPRTKVTPEHIAQAVEMHDRGMTRKQMAAELDVPYSVIAYRLRRAGLVP